MRHFAKAAVGGTFDRLHIGHEQLLHTALESAEKIVVGVTIDKLVNEKILNHLIESHEVRISAVRSWLYQKVSVERFEVVPLADTFGPTITDKSIDSLIVTSQTFSGSVLVNQKRQALGLTPLPVVEAPMIKDEDGAYVSSTGIRQGNISRQGKVYKKLFSQDVVFTSEQIESLRKVQGEVVEESQLTSDFLRQFTAVAVVGDVMTQTFLEHNLPFRYAIVDGKTRRNKTVFLPPNRKKISGENLKGSINAEIAGQLWTGGLNEIYEINGEEDLLAFVSVLSLPLQSAVFYGQPEVGIGMIRVGEAVKIHYARYIDPAFT